MTLRLFLQGERVGPQLTRSYQRNIKRMQSAQRGAAQDVVAYVVPRVRSDIERAGNFGSKWTQGFRGKVVGSGEDVRVDFTMSDQAPMRYWRVFQRGMVIRGKPLLWIPLSFASDAQGVRARDYPGRLFRVDRKSGGAPLLLSYSDRQPKYFGKRSVKIPKKFHIIEIIRDGSRKLASYYRERMKKNG